MKQRDGIRSAAYAALGLLGATPWTTWAQSESSPALEEIVVTGTRRAGVDPIESMRPIDVIGAEALAEQGSINLNDALRTQVVSLNVQRFVAQDGSAFIRPFSLRGLPPDQTLVLVNGKRRHRAALVQITNQPLAAGAQGPDLAAIPSIAIEQIEVLRDGAAAQYGSDAIAGVINFRLKEDSSGATIVARGGQYAEGDGSEYTAQANIGLPLTSEGFFNLSAEYTQSDPTSRGAQRPDAQALIDAGNSAVKVPAQRWGNVESEAARAFFNAELPIADQLSAYAFGNYGRSEGETEFFWRNPATRTDIFRSIPLTTEPGGARFNFVEWFPGGFAPIFGTKITDMSLLAGLEGQTDGGLRYDFSAGGAENELNYRLSNTVNPSLGPASPTSFDAGTITQQETQLHADFVYPWQTGVFAAPLNVAFGLEWREESFEIEPGEAASWQVGPYARVLDPDTGTFIGLAVGSSGFPGYAPSTAGEHSRSNWAAYTDLETDVTKRLTLGVAARFEDFSDFGTTFNWKFSGRFAFNDTVALRASVNTGFRAPTPGQSNISDVATNIDLTTGGLLLTATLPPTSPISQFYGAQPLEPEESFNIAAGLVFQWGDGYELSIDYFNIEVDDRIAMTSRITITPADRATLIALGSDPGQVQSVRFFGNFFDTTTEGVDVVLRKTWALDSGSQLGLTASANYTSNEVSKIRDPRAVDRERRIEISEFNPEVRGSLAVTYGRDRWHGLVRTNYYGEWTDAVPNATPTAISFDQSFPAEWLVDLELGYDFTESVTATIGAENVFDVYPDEDLRPSQRNNGIVYPQFSPFGFNGAFYYGRLTVRF